MCSNWLISSTRLCLWGNRRIWDANWTRSLPVRHADPIWSVHFRWESVLWFHCWGHELRIDPRSWELQQANRRTLKQPKQVFATTVSFVPRWVSSARHGGTCMAVANVARYDYGRLYDAPATSGSSATSFCLRLALSAANSALSLTTRAAARPPEPRLGRIRQPTSILLAWNFPTWPTLSPHDAKDLRIINSRFAVRSKVLTSVLVNFEGIRFLWFR